MIWVSAPNNKNLKLGLRFSRWEETTQWVVKLFKRLWSFHIIFQHLLSISTPSLFDVKMPWISNGELLHEHLTITHTRNIKGMGEGIQMAFTHILAHWYCCRSYMYRALQCYLWVNNGYQKFALQNSEAFQLLTSHWLAATFVRSLLSSEPVTTNICTFATKLWTCYKSQAH